jgi:large subunit ribosomal protein L25
MERVKLEVRPREGRGGKDARALRAAGKIPGVIYGGGSTDSVPVTVNVRALRQAVSGGGGLHGILEIAVDGEKSPRPAIIKELQLDPVRDLATHVDFLQVRLDQSINTIVSLLYEGTPAGVKMGGVLSQPTHEINIAALPTDIPEHVLVDVSDIEIGSAIRLGDLEPPAGVTFLDDPDLVLASVTAPTVEEEPEEEEVEGVEGEEGAEGAEAGEGEEAAGGEAAAEEPAAEE